MGSYSDPTDIQGLAHFVEHMVFMGSEKYPKENEFDSLVKVRKPFFCTTLALGKDPALLGILQTYLIYETDTKNSQNKHL